MLILVVNAGSSSLKYQLINMDDESVLVPERRCGQCGRRMVPAIDAPLEFTVSYSCVCGKREKTGIVPFR